VISESRKPVCTAVNSRAWSRRPSQLFRLGAANRALISGRYLDVTLTDLQREFERARSQPRHLVPQPKVPLARLRSGLDGVVDSLLATQHVLEMFRRALPKGPSRECLDRLSNRLTVSEARKLPTL
jgi:hypothetical protein